jgi:hypothetical protein
LRGVWLCLDAAVRPAAVNYKAEKGTLPAGGGAGLGAGVRGPGVY